jgi:hypothetical protein
MEDDEAPTFNKHHYVSMSIIIVIIITIYLP